MKFTINRSQFNHQIINVQRAISTKTTIPILTGIKLDLSKEGLTVTGSDVDISVQTFIPQEDVDNELQIDSTGAIVLPARFFSEIIKKLPLDQFTLEVLDNQQVAITSGHSEFKINGLDANNYPHLPEVSNTDQLQISSDILRQVIDETVFSASKEENRPILTGLHLQINQDQLLAVATDSHRLAQRIVKIQNSGDSDYNLVIPARSLKELEHSLSDNSEEIKLSISENQILFEFDNTMFYSRLLEGNYPKTDRLIPDSSTTKLEIDAKTLLASVERASLLSHASRNNVVKLVIDSGQKQVVLYGNSPEVGTVEEAVKVDQVEGEDLDISFNPDYLKAALQAFGETKIKLEFTAALHPFTLKPLNDDHSFIQLITPVRTFN
ncbi:DNA polymerase III subunit beta [Bombilactobacillus folatiphilus]|uniref:Beta sliding clamp n=1 Tax=Bombilactobacillus folatiphilus TaxID=2923362 RepID=A0ABY4P8S7_9LACO|nr:DNA polymerase III subunit beta [Bombilactobacillus folatiphilus]UQS82129.1 DNA polymerase III subunit beta [Bombilactobacillus folatiphilus]